MIAAQHREYRMDDIRSTTSYYTRRMEEAKVKLGLPPNATLDDLLRRVIHGDVNQELSFDAAFEVAMKAWKNQDRA
jgi:hypothetical protein